MDETAGGMQVEYRRVELGLDLGGRPLDYVNRAWLRDDVWPRAILENSGPVSIPASATIPVNAGPTMLETAGQDADPAVATVKWANRLATHAVPLARELAVNPARHKVPDWAGVPVNQALEPRGHG